MKARSLYLALLVCAVVGLSACGSSLPNRYVIEHDLGAFAYRRYQKSLDVDIPIEGNDAVGHNASYMRRDDEKRVAVATAFVTVYAQGKSLAAQARERLKNWPGYQFSVRELGGDYVWMLEGGKVEHWAVWVSGKQLVKIGAPAAEEFPESVVDAYLDTYPSDLDEHGMAKPDAESAGNLPQTPDADDKELAIPASLREGAPR